MYGKMQEFGLSKTIPLICTLAIQDQHPVLSHPEFPQGAPRWGLAAGSPPVSPEFPKGSPSGAVGAADSLMATAPFVL